jgi:hypothetical protein
MTGALTLLLALQAPLAPAPVETAPPRYGDLGSSHLGLIIGLGGGSGGFRWAGGVDYGYFVIDGVAPGVDAQVSGGTDLLTTGMLLGTLRLVPLRNSAFSLFLVGRAGRVLLSDHDDGWAAGGGAGLILFTSGRFGIQLAYDVLKLLPASFCDDLVGGCVVQGFQIGLVAGF